MIDPLHPDPFFRMPMAGDGVRVLRAVCVNHRINEVGKSDGGYTLVPMYQSDPPQGQDDARYAMVHLETWEEVIAWLQSNPIGSPLVKQ